MRVDFLNVARIVLQRKDDLPMLLSISLISISAAAGTTIVVTGTTQGGFFKTGTDVGPMNPHSYRPNEFVTNDFIYEGLVAYDGNSPNGADDEAGTMDDFIVGSLATSWVTNLVGLTQSAPFEITFTLRSGVTFHDGTPWNAAAAKANFDHIMGGTGAPGALKRNAGFHDWLGLTQYLDSWSVVDNMRFKLTFTTYYDTALRSSSAPSDRSAWSPSRCFPTFPGGRFPWQPGDKVLRGSKDRPAINTPRAACRPRSALARTWSSTSCS